MTILLSIAGISLALTWICTMLVWWHETNERAHERIDFLAVKQAEKIIRLTRRSYYASLLYSKRALGYGNTVFAKMFVKVFPNAKSAFQKHDIMTGLTTGPSSYFLHSISEAKQETPKPRVRRKKVA